MQRQLLDTLIAWKNQPARKPLLLDGARQTGKSYLLERLFGAHFPQVIRLDFLEQPSLSAIFEGSLEPQVILDNIELTFNISVNPNEDLIIFDEIGECQAAINALKFFCEKRPNMYVTASGSNIGLLNSFPVGKVELLALPPFTFEEFLWASEQGPLINAFEQNKMNPVVHDKLFNLLLDYYFVGGMPEAVNTWFNMKHEGILKRSQSVSKIHNNLIQGYERDFGKYSDKVSAQQIQAVFNNVPVQLSRNMDDSVKRFKFKDVIQKKTRYQELAGPINWLESCKLISKCHPIDTQPTSPLPALSKDNIFKLFLFDIGLLGHMLNITYKEQLEQRFHFKGYLAENFVQNELIAQYGVPTYSWEYARSEIEFLFKTDSGDILPIEVKSGKRTRAKSLGVYVQRYHPKKTIKLTDTKGTLENTEALVLPIYYAGKLAEFVR